jgi:hypothetical protein
LAAGFEARERTSRGKREKGPEWNVKEELAAESWKWMVGQGGVRDGRRGRRGDEQRCGATRG